MLKAFDNECTNQSSFTKPAKLSRAVVWSVIAAIVVVGAIAFDTKVVKIGSDSDVRQQAFSPMPTVLPNSQGEGER